MKVRQRMRAAINDKHGRAMTWQPRRWAEAEEVAIGYAGEFWRNGHAPLRTWRVYGVDTGHNYLGPTTWSDCWRWVNTYCVGGRVNIRIYA